jgi:hypothetical protein
MNGIGATATCIVLVVVAVSKFMLGAWMVLALIPILILAMWGIYRHYRSLEDALTLEIEDAPLPPPQEPVVIVPIARLDRATLQALAFARSISKDVTAVHVSDDPQEIEPLMRRWKRWGGEIPLVIVASPYRALIGPLLAYIDEIDKQDPYRPVTVVLSEFVPRHFWENPLHGQTALRLKLRLFFRPNTIVIDVPYHLNYRGELAEADTAS